MRYVVVPLMVISMMLPPLTFGAVGSALAQSRRVNDGPQRAKSFIVYEAWAYKGTPELAAVGIHPLKVVYEVELTLPPAGPLASLRSEREYSEEKIRMAALNHQLTSSEPVALDIESWGHSGVSVPKYVAAIKAFKYFDKRSTVGLYGFGPYSTRGLFKALEENRSSAYSSMVVTEKMFAPIYSVTDMSLPSLYTWDKNIPQWKETAILSLMLAKLLNPGKPVYAFISPQYYPNKEDFGLTFIDPRTWRDELETIYPIADGVVIWSGGRTADGKIIKFDERMPWYISTQAFVAAHNIK
jgi:hypothetical protein